jgi:diguanylate cyclase (GGDEF)-like protein
MRCTILFLDIASLPIVVECTFRSHPVETSKIYAMAVNHGIPADHPQSLDRSERAFLSRRGWRQAGNGQGMKIAQLTGCSCSLVRWKEGTVVKKTVLIVDDEPHVIESIRTELESNGYRVVVSSNGKDAVDLARKVRPDLILLDILMPKLSGLEVCSRLRDDFLTSRIPIVILTVLSDTRKKVIALDGGADDFLTKPFDPEEVVARIRMIIRRTETNLGSNPLTRLPENTEIYREIEFRLKSRKKFALAYLDIDNFKAFDDKYGYEKGDKIIIETSMIVQSSIARYGNKKDFVGHIGGDDFVFITTPSKVDRICQNIIKRFDEIVPSFYTEEDRKRGFIECEDRRGNLNRFPLLTLSLGVVTNATRKLSSHIQVAEIATEMKNFAKRFDGSTYKIDRRTR